MNSQNDQENEFQRVERELHERERAIRLRDIEAEINEAQPPTYQTKKHQPPESSLKQRYRQLLNVGKFFLLVVAVAVSFKIASSLATVILVGGVSWVAYKLFFERDRSKR